jgi:hypothetical protein
MRICDANAILRRIHSVCNVPPPTCTHICCGLLSASTTRFANVTSSSIQFTLLSSSHCATGGHQTNSQWAAQRFQCAVQQSRARCFRSGEAAREAAESSLTLRCFVFQACSST